MKRLICRIILFVPMLNFAQAFGDLHYGNDLIFSRKKNITSEVDGSRYIFNNFSLAQISGLKQVVALNYDAFEDEMAFIRNEEVLYLSVNEGTTFTFKDLSKKYIYINYTLDGKSKYGYLQIVSEGAKIILYKKESIIKKDGLIGLNSYQSSKNASYEKIKDIFLIHVNGTFIKIPKNSKEVGSLINIEGKNVNQFIKTNKINTNREKDLIQLVEFLNN